MKERPFVAYQHEVRAILDGSQTRFTRPIKPHPELGKPWKWWIVDPLVMDIPIALCPYGILGDRLWVRETWGAHRITGTAGGNSYYEYPNVLYRADSSTRLVIGDEVWGYVEDSFRWRPSIHMPRWASRITLEVADVRVEQDSGQWLWVVEFRVIQGKQS